MSPRPALRFPIILPPEKDQSNPQAYYASLGTTVEMTDLPNGGIEMRLTNPDGLHPASQFDQPAPLATVTTVTSGFIRYYPAASALPTPDGQTLQLPQGLQSSDIGSVVLQLSPGDQRKLQADREVNEPRPTHLVLGGLDRLGLEAAAMLQIADLKSKVLKRAWISGGGSTTQMPDEAGLRADFLQKFMAGAAALFVPAGTALGTAARVEDPPGTIRGWLRLDAHSVDGGGLATATPASIVLDDIAIRSRSVEQSRVHDGHPLEEASDEPEAMQFTVKAMIWDRLSRSYVPFAQRDVSLIRDDGSVTSLLQTVQSDSGGLVAFTETLKRRDRIAFEYDTDSPALAAAGFPSFVRSLFKRAKYYASSGQIRECYAKRLIHPLYETFWQDLRLDSADEKFGADRGNSDLEHKFIKKQEDRKRERLKDFEQFYLNGPVSSPTFNVLFEGDSWFDYPFSRDIFNHLDDLFTTRVKHPYKYNLIALQHFGDRSDQMFQIVDSDGEGQWKYTKDIFSEYPIDLVILGSGGNDLAEPGISENDRGRYGAYWKDGCFDPALAAASTAVSPAERVVIDTLVARSFAVLLRNHPWNAYCQGNPPIPQYEQVLATKLAAVAGNFGAEDGDLDTIGNLVIDHFTKNISFPPSKLSPEDDLLSAVFDGVLLMQRLSDVKTNIERFLNLAKLHGATVITHTYAYPMFRTDGTTVTGQGGDPLTGPWFWNRFEQALVIDPRIQKMALKSLIDNYVRLILSDIKSNPAYAGMFDYVDFRGMARLLPEGWRAECYWRDEMHLKTRPYRTLANEMWPTIKSKFSNQLT